MSKGLPLWPRALLGPPPGLKEITVACWAAFAGFVCVPLAVLTYLHVRSQHLSDFVYFYGIGKLLKESGAGHLYEVNAQTAIFDRLEPPTGFSWGPSPYPPYVAIVFSVFARLSFGAAYLCWLVISLALYLWSVSAVLRHALADSAVCRSLSLCLALAYSPFLMNTLMNGQLSALAVFSVGLAFTLEKRSKPLESGLSLSLLAYKPTLYLPMLAFCLVSRRHKALAGMIAGAMLACAGATMMLGPQVWRDYARFLANFSGTLGISGQTSLRAWQYVDLHSMLLLAGHGDTHAVTPLFFGLAAVFGIWLAVLLWKSHEAPDRTQDLVWASAMVWLLLINVYVPYYDASLAVLPIALAVGAAWRQGTRNEVNTLVALAVVFIVVSWVSADVARSSSVQLLGLLLLALGIWLGWLLYRALGQNGFTRFSPRSLF